MQNTELKNLLIITISFTLLYIHHSIYITLYSLEIINFVIGVIKKQ